jgi:hypothetical protein
MSRNLLPPISNRLPIAIDPFRRLLDRVTLMDWLSLNGLGHFVTTRLVARHERRRAV